MALGVSSSSCLCFGVFSGFFGRTLCVPLVSPPGAVRGAGSTPALGLFNSQLGKTNSARRLRQCWERSLFPPGAGAAPELCLLLMEVAFLSLWMHLRQLLLPIPRLRGCDTPVPALSLPPPPSLAPGDVSTTSCVSYTERASAPINV